MHRINQADLPARSFTTQLRRKPQTRVIGTAFEVTDGICREIPTQSGSGTFRPDSIAVRINLDTGGYTVELTGFMIGTHVVGYALRTGEHYADADTDDWGIVGDAVHDTLDAHGLIVR